MGRVIIIVRNDIQTFGLHIHNRDIQIIGTIKIGIFELRRQYLELCLVDQIFRKAILRVFIRADLKRNDIIRFRRNGGLLRSANDCTNAYRILVLSDEIFGGG